MECPVCGVDDMKTLHSRAVGRVTMRHRQCQRCETQWFAMVEETIVQGSVIPGRLDDVRQLPLLPPSPTSENVEGCPNLDILPQGEMSQASKENVQGCHALDISQVSTVIVREESKSTDRPEAENKHPPLVTFPVIGNGKGGTWALTQPLLDALTDAYQGVDVLTEAKRALAWVHANMGRRKTGAGMPRFLTNWIARAANSGKAAMLGTGSASKAAEDRERLYAMYGRKAPP